MKGAAWSSPVESLCRTMLRVRVGLTVLVPQCGLILQASGASKSVRPQRGLWGGQVGAGTASKTEEPCVI